MTKGPRTLVISVTKKLNYLFNIWPGKTMKICPTAKNGKVGSESKHFAKHCHTACDLIELKFISVVLLKGYFVLLTLLP